MTEAFFDDRYSPRRLGAGPKVPVGVREGLLDWLNKRNVGSARVGELLLTKLGCSSWADLAEDVEGRYPAESGLPLRFALEDGPDLPWMPGARDNELAMRGLRTVPTDLFLTALECVAQAVRRRDLAEAPASLTVGVFVGEVNRIFDLRGVDFRVSDDGWADWHGDKGAYQIVIEPALAVLSDARLQGARSEFEAALSHLRVGTDKEREDAIEEAAKSVESAMKVVLADRNVSVSATPTAKPLFDALKNAGLVPQYSEYSVLGASHIRNKIAGHGVGSSPRVIDGDEAALCVRAAANALVFLAALLS